MEQKEKNLVIFEDKKVRRNWYKDQWYLSVIDVIEVLTSSSIPKRYWSDLKIKLKNEGSEVYEKIVQLKFTASDGKKYGTDCFSIADIFRIIQSIPSPKAEPFKLWLAQVGKERIDEIRDPTCYNIHHFYVIMYSWQKEHQSKRKPRVLAKPQSVWQRSSLGRIRSNYLSLVQRTNH